MTVNNRATDRQPHAQPIRLCRVKRLEQARCLGFAEADAGILDGDDRPRTIVTLVGGRTDDDPAPRWRDLAHGLGSIHQQIQENLL